jgi:hypothetical protein
MLIHFTPHEHYGTGGVGVEGPYLLYFCSIAVLICLSVLPSSIILITSRVMPMQMVQPTLIGSNSNRSVGELSLI